jgi:hypothetical protein
VRHINVTSCCAMQFLVLPLCSLPGFPCQILSRPVLNRTIICEEQSRWLDLLRRLPHFHTLGSDQVWLTACPNQSSNDSSQRASKPQSWLNVVAMEDAIFPRPKGSKCKPIQVRCYVHTSSGTCFLDRRQIVSPQHVQFVATPSPLFLTPCELHYLSLAQ